MTKTSYFASMISQSYLLPPAWFPQISYFALLSLTQEVFIEIHDTYPKQTLRNRCTILSTQGPLHLTIPVSKPYGSKSKTNEILIYEHKDWPNKHWRAIQSAYNKSPYFLHYSDAIRGVVFSSNNKLFERSLESLNVVLSILKFDAIPQVTKEYRHENPQIIDLRDFDSHLSVSMVAGFPVYTQVFSDRLRFQPNLSIIDLLCNLGPESASYINKVARLIRDKQS